MMTRLIAFAVVLMMAHSAWASERIVIAGGSIAELVWALDAGEAVVGVDQTTAWPPETQKLPQIGYWKQLSAEGILALRPTTFITWQDAQPQMVFDQLKRQNVNVVTLPRTPATLEMMYANIQTLAQVVNHPQQGSKLVADLKARLARIAALNTQQTPVRVMFLLSPGGSAPQVAGVGSVADAILTLAGAKNVATHPQYRSWSGEAIIAARPDVIVVTTQSMEAGGKQQLATVAGITRTNAWQQGRIVEIDQSLILGMGPRIVDAVELLHQQFFPE